MVAREEALERLREVMDPELGLNIVDLGLVYGLDVDREQRTVHVDLTLTSPGCPLGPQIIRDIKRELRSVEGGVDVCVDLVWSPLWQPSLMSDYAKDVLGYDDELGLGLG